MIMIYSYIICTYLIEKRKPEFTDKYNLGNSTQIIKFDMNNIYVSTYNNIYHHILRHLGV